MRTDKLRIDVELKSKIRRMRNLAELTQQDLADKIEVHVSQISDYERNKVIPSSYILFKIAVALNCTADDLYEIKIIKK